MSEGLLHGSLPGDLMRRHLENIKARMIEAMAEKGRNASMRSVQSLEIRASDMEGEITGSKAWTVMERGKPGGKVPASFHSIILQWATEKGIKVDPMPYKTDRPHKYTPESRALMSWAYCVSRKIANEGTLLWRQQGFDDIYSGIIATELDAMDKELTELASTEVHILNEKIMTK